MKKPKKDRKRAAAAAIAILLALLMLLGSLAPFIYAANDDASAVEITAELGLSGFYKVGVQTPAKIVLENNGKGFSGEVNIRINVGDSSNKKYAVHSYPVEMPENSAKAITMDVTIKNLSYLQNQLRIEVVDEKGNVLAKKNLAPGSNARDPNKVTAAALTDGEDSLNHIKSMKLDLKNNAVLRENLAYLDEEDFPENSRHLKVFDLLFIDNYDTGRLSEAQTEAMGEWVRGGGMLVLGGGFGEEKVMRRMEHLLEDSTQGNTVYALQPEGNENDFTSPAFSFTPYGGGKIALANFDLSDPKMADSEEIQAFVEEALGLEFSEIQTFVEAEDYFYYRGNYKYSNLPSMNTGMIVAIFVLIIAYVVVIGPILYAILKKMDKREMGFVVIPCVAIGITLAIYGLSYNTVYKRPILNTFGYVDIYNGQSSVNYRNKTGAMIAQKGNVDVSVSNVRSTPEVELDRRYMYYGSNAVSTPEDAYKITYGEDPKITFFNNTSWNVNVFTYTGEGDMGGELTMEVESNDGIVSGVLHNGTLLDFEDIIIGAGFTFENFGGLLAGETKEFKLNRQIFSASSHYFNSYDLLKSDDYKGEEYRLKELKRTILDEKYEMEHGGGNYGVSYSATSFPGAVTTTTSAVQVVRSGGVGGAPRRDFNITMYAFNNAEIGSEAVTVNKKTPIEFQMNVYSMTVPLDIIGDGRIKLDFGIIGVSDIVSNNYYYFNEDILEIYDAGNYELQYLFPEHQRVEVFAFRYPANLTGALPTLTIYNNATGEWENLAFVQYTENVQDYFDEEGKIRINLEAQKDIRLSPPQFRVEGGERID